MTAAVPPPDANPDEPEGTPPSADVAAWLQAAASGDLAAAEALFEHLYDDLRRIARARLRGGIGLSQLGTTALVHESYLKLWSNRLPNFKSVEHFLAYAARTMRSVVVDAVRQRQALRHGGDVQHTSLDTQLGERLAAPDDEVLNVHVALDELERNEPRLAQVVELRYFAGMSDAEIGALLGVAERTVQRDWQKARLMLARALA